MELTHKDVQEIMKIIDGAEHLDEIELVLDSFRLHAIRSRGGGAPAQSVRPPAPVGVKATPQPTPTPTAGATNGSGVAHAGVPDGVVAIRAPMLGTFYRAPAPNERPFVEVGQQVRADDTVCMIEVMKLFNSIRAGIDGVVEKIVVENGSLVEFDQVLIHVAPNK